MVYEEQDFQLKCKFCEDSKINIKYSRREDTFKI